MYIWGTELCELANAPPAKFCAYPVHLHYSSLVEARIAVVACGLTFNVALTEDGELYSWGYGAVGQLGLAYTTVQPRPCKITENIPAGTRFKDVCAGEHHVLALTDSNELYAWGANDMGQLGTGDFIPLNRPTRVLRDEKFKSISARSDHSVALNEQGQCFVWGSEWMGQAEDSKFGAICSPRRVSEELTFSWVCAGADCTFCGTKRNKIYSWGNGSHGKLGHGDIKSQLFPTLINFFTKQNIRVVKMAVGDAHALLLCSNGEIWSWGGNAYGEAGQDCTNRQLQPKRVVISREAPTFFVDIAAGCRFSVALSDQGECFTCGSADNGVLGNGGSETSVLSLTPIKFDGFAKRVFAGKKPYCRSRIRKSSDLPVTLLNLCRQRSFSLDDRPPTSSYAPRPKKCYAA
ncbi:uncharacterized protein LOC126304760 [Schistocerca gregaria]|uniref:uncharacterized protein LOC126304760 n=1 Tax=Schistocerca gregaria TaxID=7010 RepID=UPI00211E5B0A|nr:uncharacterized protein LOC126304760 [Schistocerca gregaria]